jgi:hypothetical protein
MDSDTRTLTSSAIAHSLYVCFGEDGQSDDSAVGAVLCVLKAFVNQEKHVPVDVLAAAASSLETLTSPPISESVQHQIRQVGMDILLELLKSEYVPPKLCALKAIANLMLNQDNMPELVSNSSSLGRLFSMLLSDNPEVRQAGLEVIGVLASHTQVSACGVSERLTLSRQCEIWDIERQYSNADADVLKKKDRELESLPYNVDDISVAPWRSELMPFEGGSYQQLLRWKAEIKSDMDFIKGYGKSACSVIFQLTFRTRSP